jgi:hypothetical protein
MGDFNLEGDVAAPLARFRKKTARYTVIVVSIAAMQVGLAFSILDWQKNDHNVLATIWPLAPIVLELPVLLFARYAYLSEQGTKQQGAVLALLRAILSLDVIVLTFYCGFEWLS